MHSHFRRCFNQAFSKGLYQSFMEELSRRVGTRIDFRVAETPVFIPDDLRERLVLAARGILAQLCDPARLEAMKKAIPPELDTPGMSGLPSFAQIDFAAVRAPDGTLVPRLIELQGFPSLTALMVIMRDVWNETLRRLPGLDLCWSSWFSDLDRAAFLELARRTIVGDQDPKTVVLMDLDPPSQKTYPDFEATKLLFGVETICPTSVVRQGRRLLRKVNGGLVPIRRIYNRVVFDELHRKGLELPFRYDEDLDVEWTPHPNWYWAWSKYSVPFLDHPAVPRAKFLSDLDPIPEDLSGYVLKPLFSFAGGGVKVAPTASDVGSIPKEERCNWCLQERVKYEPALQTPDGAGVKVEIRLMLLKPDDLEMPVIAQNLCRLSRGLMLGVDFNKEFDWVGGTIGLWPEDRHT